MPKETTTGRPLFGYTLEIGPDGKKTGYLAPDRHEPLVAIIFDLYRHQCLGARLSTARTARSADHPVTRSSLLRPLGRVSEPYRSGSGSGSRPAVGRTAW